MKKTKLLYRVIIILVVTIGGLYIVIGPHRRPKAGDFTLAGIKNTLAENIHLGLDLKGGSHLVMRVKVEEMFSKLAADNAAVAQKVAEDKGIKVTNASFDTANNNYRFMLTVEDPSRLKELQGEVAKKVDTREWVPAVSGNTAAWTLTATAQRDLGQQATEQAYKIIDSRINSLGVAEPTLQFHGAQSAHEILLQMPGIQDPERVKQLLVGESRLELVQVVDPRDPNPDAPQGAPQTAPTFNSQQEAVQALGGSIPPNRRVLPYDERDEPTTAGGQAGDQNAQKQEKWVVVVSPEVVNGSELRNAQAGQGRAGGEKYEIDFQLKKSGADKFGPWTTSHVNKNMGVVLNDRVKSIAYIKQPIYDEGQITGNFTQQSAEDLAMTLRSGALPAKIEYQEERTVGPSLGADSIRSGVTASLAGLGLVIAFMLFYYRGSGVNAVVALLLNMILMIAAIVMFKATLTLPGIAGIILTIGMAVDSNVLIFERIREELGTGKTVASAVDMGFKRAFVTIIDTHVTTVVSSLFLFVFGTGPIKGFAVTLIFGLLINLFSAVYVSRTIFIWHLNQKGRRPDSLSI
ncbi:MAG: protein translocase subunit SecD [Acidobacteriota bacterium]|nr:protein translocase subunit SecD [Acidobacteriota bacterium]